MIVALAGCGGEPPAPQAGPYAPPIVATSPTAASAAASVDWGPLTLVRWSGTAEESTCRIEALVDPKLVRRVVVVCDDDVLYDSDIRGYGGPVAGATFRERAVEGGVIWALRYEDRRGDIAATVSIDTDAGRAVVDGGRWRGTTAIEPTPWTEPADVAPLRLPNELAKASIHLTLTPRLAGTGGCKATVRLHEADDEGLTCATKLECGTERSTAVGACSFDGNQLRYIDAPATAEGPGLQYDAETERASIVDGTSRRDFDTASGQIGIAACDEYIVFYTSCVEHKAPEAVREQMKRAISMTVDAWKKVAEEGNGSVLETTCKAASEAMKKATAAWGC